MTKISRIPPVSRPPRPLREVLRHRNRAVVDRFLKELPIGEEDAEDVFRETKRWLWLLASAPGHELAITTPLLVLDEMWHTFILFTRPYAEFCQRYCGRFVHHMPTPEREKQRMQARFGRNPEVVAREIEARNRRQYEIVLEHLGEATLRKWYVEYPEKYPYQRLQELRRAASLAA